MCSVCEKNGNTFDLLKPFLKKSVTVKFAEIEGGWQEIYLVKGERVLTITADGDEGGYFHFKSKVPELVTKSESLFKNLKFVSSHKQWSLDPNLSVAGINAVLTGVIDQGKSGDSKCRHTWDFSYKGEECSIWDYKGSRWSGYGPLWVFDEIGLKVVGT